MWVLFLAPLILGVFGQTDKGECMNAAGEFNKNAKICDDKYSTATCDKLFGDEEGSGEAPMTGVRPEKCFANAEMKKIATESCANTCGYCCINADWSCANTPGNSGLKCNSMGDQCEDPTWRPILAKYCPKTCGFCMMGDCIDKAPECRRQKTICYSADPYMLAFAKENCARTCNQCGSTSAPAPSAPAPAPPPAPAPAPVTTTTPKPYSPCVDTDVKCPTWKANGVFCGNPFYKDQWYKCRKSCGICV